MLVYIKQTVYDRFKNMATAAIVFVKLTLVLYRDFIELRNFKSSFQRKQPEHILNCFIAVFDVHVTRG